MMTATNMRIFTNSYDFLKKVSEKEQEINGCDSRYESFIVDKDDEGLPVLMLQAPHIGWVKSWNKKTIQDKEYFVLYNVNQSTPNYSMSQGEMTFLATSGDNYFILIQDKIISISRSLYENLLFKTHLEM